MIEITAKLCLSWNIGRNWSVWQFYCSSVVYSCLHCILRKERWKNYWNPIWKKKKKYLLHTDQQLFFLRDARLVGTNCLVLRYHLRIEIFILNIASKRFNHLSMEHIISARVDNYDHLFVSTTCNVHADKFAPDSNKFTRSWRR